MLIPTPSHVHGIDGEYAVDFLGAKLEARMRQQPQAPKPCLDCTALRHAEYNAWISSQHQKVSAAASHVGVSPQGNATKTSMPVREFLRRLRHGLQPLWLSAATPLGGGSTSPLLNWLSRKLLSC